MSVKIGVIVGSTRPNRVGLRVAEWFVDQVKDTEGIEFELVDLKDWELPFLNETESADSGKPYTHDYTKKWSEKISGFDGYVWVSPEYNRGYSAVLKNAIDYLYNEWSKKPVGFVSYGGFAGARAVEQLKLIAVGLQMMPINASIGIVAPWDAFEEDGRMKDGRALGNMTYLASQLKDWGEALGKIRS